LVLAPLVAACPGGPVVNEVVLPQGLTVPDCAAGNLLGTDKDGKLTCLTPPSTNVVIDTCKDDQVLNSDGTKLSCVDKAKGGTENPQNTRITTLTTKVEDLTKTATNIGASGGSVALYLGNSTATTKGNFLKAGDDNSLVSAAKMCEATFPGKSAHMCTVEEIYTSVVKGKITSAMTIPKAWVYMTEIYNPVAGATDPNYSFGNNCASYNYPTADQKWTGVAFSTAKIAYNNQWAVRFHNGLDATTGAPCNATLPVACCGN
jgi:hypothetical protein